MDRAMVQPFRLLVGISAENDFPPEIRQVLHSYNGSLLPGTSTEKIETWYEYYVRTMKEYGFDFLKIDNQSFTLPALYGRNAGYPTG